MTFVLTTNYLDPLFHYVYLILKIYSIKRPHSSRPSTDQALGSSLAKKKKCDLSLFHREDTEGYEKRKKNEVNDNNEERSRRPNG